MQLSKEMLSLQNLVRLFKGEGRAARGLLAIGCLLLSACRAPEDYFPTPDQGQWRYRLTWDSPGLATTTYYVQRVIDPPQGLEDQSHIRVGLDGRGLAYRRDAEGIWQVARIEPESNAATPLASPVMVLPADPAPGMQWTVSARPLLLTRLVTTINAGQASLASADSFLRDVVVRYTVQSVGEPSEDADHLHQDCVKVLGEADDELVGAPQFGRLALHIEEQLTYCRGFGLVSLRRHERTDRQWASDLRLVMTLERYDSD